MLLIFCKFNLIHSLVIVIANPMDNNFNDANNKLNTAEMRNFNDSYFSILSL